MRRISLACGATRPLLAVMLLAAAAPVRAQDIEPRAYSNAPVGVNFLIAGYAYTRGGLSFDSAVPITEARLATSSAVVAYARVLDLWGMSAKVDAVLPYTWLSGSANFAGQPIERTVDGLGDARFRLSVNFIGAPALTLREFAAYRQDVIVGASLAVSAPVGQYDSSRAVNLGTNRWSFRPELGVAKALGPVTVEFAAAATFFTDNADFLNGRTRAQDPIYSFRANAIYGFGSGIWASADAVYFTGGRTSIDGAAGNDRQSNWRLGATLSIPLSRNYSLRLYGSRGVSSRTRNDFDLLGIAVQYRWGGGL